MAAQNPYAAKPYADVLRVRGVHIDRPWLKGVIESLNV